jgi:hypothetical protein
MKQGTFEKEIFVAADAKTVLDIFVDFGAHHELHPLIVHVERAKDEPPGVRRYFITDKLEWGPFKFKIKYRADILSITDESVHTEAYSSPRTKVTSIVRVSNAEGGVILHEHVELEAPDWLFAYAFRQADAAHTEMLERMRVLAESRMAR